MVKKIKTFTIQWSDGPLNVDIAQNGKFVLAISAGKDLYGNEHFKEFNTDASEVDDLLHEIIQALGSEILERNDYGEKTEKIIKDLEAENISLKDAINKAAK